MKGKGAMAGEKKSRSGPRIIVEGVVMEGASKNGRRSLLALVSFAFLGFLAITGGLLSSCSGSGKLRLDASGGGRLELKGEIPPLVAAKLRKLSSLPADRPLFDAKSAQGSMEKGGVSLISFSTPSPDSFVSSLEAKSLEGLAARKEMAGPKALSLTSKAGAKTLAIHLERGNCRPLLDLVPGLDPELIAALSPPALDPEPLSRAEYRAMLVGILGEKAVAALEASKISLEIEAPSAILASRGGSAKGRVFTASIPCLDLLVLEKPLDFSLSW